MESNTSKENNLASFLNNSSVTERKIERPLIARVQRKYFQSVPLEEVLPLMRAKEVKFCLKSYSKQGLAQCRTILVEWMLDVGGAFSLCLITIHTSVTLLDNVLLNLEVTRSKLQLVACACILLSAKLNEMEDKIPSVEELNYCTDNAFTPELIVQMETIILNHFRWNVNVITPSHFLDFFLPCALTDYDTINDQKIISQSSVKRDLNRIAYTFIDLCCLDQSFLDYLPSLVAASSIALTRKRLNITPVWSDELASITQYDYLELESCVDHIWSTYQNKNLQPTTGT